MSKKLGMIATMFGLLATLDPLKAEPIQDFEIREKEEAKDPDTKENVLYLHRMHAGHSIFSLNMKTGEIVKEQKMQDDVLRINQNRNRGKIVPDPDKIYCTRLNKKNATKFFVKVLRQRYAIMQTRKSIENLKEEEKELIDKSL